MRKILLATVCVLGLCGGSAWAQSWKEFSPQLSSCFVWAPASNITPYELALSQGVMTFSATHQDWFGIGRAQTVQMVEALPPGARRNFRPCSPAERRAGSGG